MPTQVLQYAGFHTMAPAASQMDGLCAVWLVRGWLVRLKGMVGKLDPMTGPIAIGCGCSPHLVVVLLVFVGLVG